MGSKLLSQGTKCKMTLYEHGCIEVEGAYMGGDDEVGVLLVTKAVDCFR